MECDPITLKQEVLRVPVFGSTEIKSVRGFKGSPVLTLKPWYENVGLIVPHCTFVVNSVIGNV
jgi:hypothetical protein